VETHEHREVERQSGFIASIRFFNGRNSKGREQREKQKEQYSLPKENKRSVCEKAHSCVSAPLLLLK
jgi:hypothetical protein